MLTNQRMTLPSSSSESRSRVNYDFGFGGPTSEVEKYQSRIDQAIKQINRLSFQLVMMTPRKEQHGAQQGTAMLFELDTLPGGKSGKLPGELYEVVRKFRQDLETLKTQSETRSQFNELVNRFMQTMSGEPIVRQYKHWPDIQAKLADLVATSPDLERE